MNATKYKLALPVFLWLTMTFAVNAQQLKAIGSLENKISLYGKKKQSPVLFVHFDKNVYTNNEQVWLTGYLLGADYAKYQVLSVALVKDADRSIWMEDRFQIKNGFAFGNTTVPDSVGPGNYTFIVTTDRLKNGKPDVVFEQPVTLKTKDVQTYTASLNPVDTSANGPQQKVMLLVGFLHTKDIPQTVPVSYYVGNSAHPVLQGKLKTKAGQYVFNIPSAQLVLGNNVLHVQVNYKNEVKEIGMALSAKAKPAIVAFYPEGGDLVNNIQSNVGFEVKNGAGNPIATSAFLYENDRITDTIQTNSYGLGRFNITPKAGSNYTVKLYNADINRHDTTYKLPNAITAGPTLTLTNAVINDTLTVIVKDNVKEKLYLTGHNYKQLFFTQPVNMTTSIKRIKFILKDVPKGLIQLTLTDSTGRPFAERIFFAHYNQRTPLTITTDKDEYATRQKVTVKVKLDTGLPDSGLVSVACVQENRIEIKKKNDIESYFYLTRDLGSLPVRETYLANTEADKNFLENILLIKGWSRYTWTDMLKTQAADTLNNYNDLNFGGVVKQRIGMGYGRFETQENREKALKKPIVINNMNDLLNPVITDSKGNFILSNAGLITPLNKKVSLKFKEEDPAEFHLHLTDTYNNISKVLAGQFEPREQNIIEQSNTINMELASNEHAIHLKEVKINDNSDNALFYGIAGKRTSDACGEYVCPSGYLNCPNDIGNPNNTAPIPGVSYPIYGANVKVDYEGCPTDPHPGNSVQFKGIYVAQEFYPVDFSKTDISEPQYLSTLFWKHQLKVSSTKETEFSFYTGDITGRFKIIVQGVTSNDVTYGEKTFNVVKGK